MEKLTMFIFALIIPIFVIALLGIMFGNENFWMKFGIIGIGIIGLITAILMIFQN